MSESETSSAAQIFRIKRQISQTKQGIADVTTYFNFLKGLLVELDLYRNIEFESAADAKKFNDIMERDRAIQFLVGLNPEYDEVCHQLLAKEPFPDLEEAFVYVRGEESNRGLKREIDKARTENSDIASTSGSQMAQTRIGTNQNLGMSEQQQAQSGVQSDGANNNSVAGILLSQLASAKYVKIWEGNLSGQRQGQPVFITRLEGYRSATASETLAANWPATMQIVRLISQDHMYNKQYVGKADFLVFRALNQHGFLGQLQEKKLCAVIQVPSQTLLLSVSDKACRLIGMLFPGDMIVFKPQISNQQQHPQLQQQQHTQLQQQQQLPQLQQQQQIPQLQQQQLPQLQQQQMPQLQPQQQQIPQLPQLQQQQMPQLQQQPPLPQQQQQQNQLSGLQPQQQLPNLQQLQQIPQQQQMVGAGMGPGYVQDPGWSQLVSQGQASSQGQPTMPGGGRMG